METGPGEGSGPGSIISRNIVGKRNAEGIGSGQPQRDE
jgi:hypothetical protein